MRNFQFFNASAIYPLSQGSISFSKSTLLRTSSYFSLVFSSAILNNMIKAFSIQQRINSIHFWLKYLLLLAHYTIKPIYSIVSSWNISFQIGLRQYPDPYRNELDNSPEATTNNTIFIIFIFNNKIIRLKISFFHSINYYLSFIIV